VRSSRCVQKEGFRSCSDCSTGTVASQCRTATRRATAHGGGCALDVSHTHSAPFCIRDLTRHGEPLPPTAVSDALITQVVLGIHTCTRLYPKY
jgi:hypothetical protein